MLENLTIFSESTLDYMCICFDLEGMAGGELGGLN